MKRPSLAAASRVLNRAKNIFSGNAGTWEIYEAPHRQARRIKGDMISGWDHPKSPYNPTRKGWNFPRNILQPALEAAIGPMEKNPDKFGEINLVSEWQFDAEENSTLDNLGVKIDRNYDRMSVTTQGRQKRRLSVLRLQPNGNENKTSKQLVLIIPGIGPGAHATVPSRLAVLLSQFYDTLVLHNREQLSSTYKGPYTDRFSPKNKAEILYRTMLEGFQSGEYDPKKVVIYTHSGGYEVLLELMKIIKERNETVMQNFSPHAVVINRFPTAKSRNEYYEQMGALKQGETTSGSITRLSESEWELPPRVKANFIHHRQDALIQGRLSPEYIKKYNVQLVPGNELLRRYLGSRLHDYSQKYQEKLESEAMAGRFLRPADHFFHRVKPRDHMVQLLLLASSMAYKHLNQ